jgi:hypothetical protein
MNSSQSYPIVALGNNAWYVHDRGVSYHDYPNPPVIPNEKDDRENEDDPMRELSSAGF